MSDLTPEEKSAIREAVAIVRDDNRDKMLREIHERTSPPPEPPPGPEPPPARDPASPPKPKRRSSYWGDLDD